jgi:hypothetical protein
VLAPFIRNREGERLIKSNSSTTLANLALRPQQIAMSTPTIPIRKSAGRIWTEKPEVSSDGLLSTFVFTSSDGESRSNVHGFTKTSFALGSKASFSASDTRGAIWTVRVGVVVVKVWGGREEEGGIAPPAHPHRSKPPTPPHSTPSQFSPPSNSFKRVSAPSSDGAVSRTLGPATSLTYRPPSSSTLLTGHSNGSITRIINGEQTEFRTSGENGPK